MPDIISDNIRVGGAKDYSNYFSINCSPTNDDWKPYEVNIGRYIVPGRCNYYTFDWIQGQSGVAPRIRFCSETGTPLTEAMKMVKRDLNLPQVVKLLKDICRDTKNVYYSRLLVEQLLSEVGRGTKAYRACKRALDDARQRRKELQDSQQ
jgi:hypothetical protein